MVNTGLEGVTVAETRLSDIDGDNGTLTIAGFPVEELAVNATYEETLFLLLHDRLPDRGELQSFRADLVERRAIAPQVRELLREAANEEAPAMDALRMGLAAASIGDGAGNATDPEETAKRVVAVIPTIVATYWRYRQGNAPLDPDPELGHAANYLWLLTGETPDD
jgi:citrate synthase